MCSQIYEDFLLDRCAVCFVHFENSDTKLNKIRVAKANEDSPNCNEDFSVELNDEVPSAEAISFIFNVSKEYFGKSLLEYFKNVKKELKAEQLLELELEAPLCFTEIVFCQKCASLVVNIYKWQKRFRRTINNKSLIWNTLGKVFQRDKRILSPENLKTPSEIKIETETELDVLSENDQLVDNDDSLGIFNGDHDLIKTDINSDDELLPEDYINFSNHEETTSKSNSKHPTDKILRRKEDLLPTKIMVVPLEQLKYSKISNYRTSTRRQQKISKIQNVDEVLISQETEIARKRNCTLKAYSLVEKGVKEIENDNEKNEDMIKDLEQSSDDDYELSEVDGQSDNNESSDDSYKPVAKKCTKRKITKYTKKKCVSKAKSSKRKYDKVSGNGNTSSKKTKTPISCDPEHSVNDYLSCQHCGIKFASYFSLHEHIIVGHSDIKITVHHEKISGPPFNCPQCSESWLTWKSLKSHCLRYHDLDIPMARKTFRNTKTCVVCPECGISFGNCQGLTYHMSKAHGLKDFPCVICEKPFSLKSDLEIHMSADHPSWNAPSGSGLPEETELPFEFCDEPYFCRKCNFRSQFRQGILCHNRVCHNNAKKYDCKYCKETFGATATLIVHLSEVHEEVARPERNEDQYTCSECEIEYHSYGSLRKHMKVTGHKNYISKCSFCEKTFTQLEDLRIHKVREHNDKIVGSKSVIINDRHFRKRTKAKLAVLEKLSKFQCPFCTQQFSSEKESENHKSTHDKSEQLVFRCCRCPKSFPKESSFNRHRLRVHDASQKTRECTECGKTFDKQRSYRRHLATHSQPTDGERPVCHICGNTFKTSKYLQKHINVRHLGKEAKQCDQCGYLGRTNWDIKCHKKVHEKNGKTRNRIPKIPFQNETLNPSKP